MQRLAMSALGLAMLALAVTAWPARSEAQSGVVRIYNSTVMPVTVYSLQVDYFGYRRWQPIGQIPPNGAQDFPGVPAGSVFGAQLVGSRRQWPPFTIVYPYGPIFEYRLF